VDPRFAHDAFLVTQLVRPLVNLYEVHALGPGSDVPGEQVAFVRQKRAAIKEDLRAFADSSEREEVFRIKARQVLEIGGRYNVTAPDGTPLGSLERRFKESLLRTRWRILDPDGAELLFAEESSMAVAIGRRIKELVPFGELLPLPYHFTFARDGAEIGGLRRVYGVRDRYRLDLSRDPERSIDRRLAVALAVGLDAFQAR
jgi:uncharacterized protein YxjI